jgi:hypothetical protein
MLKLTYTETSFFLECFTQSLEDWVQARVILAMRIGQPLCVEPSNASFLLPVDLPEIDVLYGQTKRQDREILSVCACDTEYLEVSLRGSWLSCGTSSVEGVFVTEMSDRTEFFLHKLWLEAQLTVNC